MPSIQESGDPYGNEPCAPEDCQTVVEESVQTPQEEFVKVCHNLNHGLNQVARDLSSAEGARIRNRVYFARLLALRAKHPEVHYVPRESLEEKLLKAIFG